MLSSLTPEQLANATPEQFERLQALLEAERSATVDVFDDPRSPMADYLLEFGGPPPQSTSRQAAHHDGERPSIAEFITSFAPALPPAPPKSTPAVASTVPDVSLVVPARRQPKLLQDVIRATEDAMRHSAQSDEDRLALYRGGRPIDFGGAYSDE